MEDGCDLTQHLSPLLLHQPLRFLEHGSGMLGQRSNMLPLRSKETHWTWGDQVEQPIVPLEGIYEHGPGHWAPRNCSECSWHFTSCRPDSGTDLTGPSFCWCHLHSRMWLQSPGSSPGAAWSQMASHTCLPVAADCQRASISMESPISTGASAGFLRWWSEGSKRAWKLKVWAGPGSELP